MRRDCSDCRLFIVCRMCHGAIGFSVVIPLDFCYPARISWISREIEMITFERMKPTCWASTSCRQKVIFIDFLSPSTSYFL